MTYHWETNPNDVRYKRELNKEELNKEELNKKELNKGYLRKLSHLEKYMIWIQDNSRKDNLTTLKDYFDTYIFIHIQDFKDGRYNMLFTSNGQLKEHVNITGPYSRKAAKKEGYKIFLRMIIN